jgi:hypothetical protein
MFSGVGLLFSAIRKAQANPPTITLVPCVPLAVSRVGRPTLASVSPSRLLSPAIATKLFVPTFVQKEQSLILIVQLLRHKRKWSDFVDNIWQSEVKQVKSQ